MTPEERSLIQNVGAIIWQSVRSYIVVCLMYGFFAPLTLVTIHNQFNHHGLSPISAKVTFGVIILNFLATTVVVLAFIMDALGFLSVFFHEIFSMPLEDTGNIAYGYSENRSRNGIANRVALFLPIVSDALIIWRAWAVFLGRSWAKYILTIMWITSLVTSILWIILGFRPTNIPFLVLPKDTTDIMWGASALGLSFGTNLLATSFIAKILWHHLKFLKNLNIEPREHSKFCIWRVIKLLVDTGFVYCVVQLAEFIASFVTAFYGPAKSQSPSVSIFTYVYFMLSGFYPTVVMYLVDELSSAAGIHEAAASQMLESRRRANGVAV